MSDTRIKDTKITLGFYGGVGSVTGANFLLADSNTKILVDCGLIQGKFYGEDPNRAPFLYSPSEIDFLLITHAHTDHIGRIPKLVKDGFKGVIYSTHATRDLAVYMLEDAAKIQKYHADKNDTEPLYTQADVDAAIDRWQTIDYHEQLPLQSFSAYFKDAGHVLGSAIIEVTHTNTKKKVAFSGDLGNIPSPLLPPTEKVTDADYIVMESVYGDRVHEERDSRKQHIQEVANKVLKRGGTLIIPVFSLEKTQILLKELNDLIEDGHIPSVPVFFDSPLGIKLTEVYSNYTNLFKEKVQKEIADGDDIFDFPKLNITLRRRESETIAHTEGAKIIVASSGLSEGGRITAHEKHFLPDPKNALLIIGYQIAGTAGRRIQEGAKQVTIDGTDVPINAEIISVSGYSSHADSNQLLDFVEPAAEKVKRVFVTMGEPKSSLYLVQKLRDYLGVKAEMPDEGEVVEL